MRGQVWWADDEGCSRPWLVLQAEALNETAPTVIAARVTIRRPEAGFPLTVCLDPSETGLSKPAWVCATQVRSLRRESFEEPIVTLSDERMSEVMAALGRVLDMNIPTGRARHRRKRLRPGGVSAVGGGVP